MDRLALERQFEQYYADSQIGETELIVRKGGVLVFHGLWAKARKDSIYRMMSMTKPVVAAGVLLLVEEGRLDLDDCISRYIPGFKDMRVSCDSSCSWSPSMDEKTMVARLHSLDISKVRTEPANRELTIRDLLSHSSGLEQGLVGLAQSMVNKYDKTSLKEEAEHYSRYILGFQPGSDTGYSPLAGFDVLGRIIEIVTDMQVDEYLRERLFDPLEMDDTFFWTDDRSLLDRIVPLYARLGDSLKDVTDTDMDIDGVIHRSKGFVSCSGGLFSTCTDYEHFADMLCSGGVFRGTRVMKSDTVKLMCSEGPRNHLEPDPGMVWGLGVKIRQDKSRGGFPCPEGSYGWSGAFGTHFIVCPEENIDFVLTLNRADIGGSGSFISRRVEELVFADLASHM